jgi:hypothetical protein
VASGRKRGGIRQRGWLRRGTYDKPQQSVDAPHAAGADPGEDEDEGEGEGGSGGGESWGAGDDQDGGGGGAPAGPDTQASLDQVLRSAAEARDKGGDKDGAG